MFEQLRLDGLLEENRYTADTLFKAISAELVTIGSLARQNQSDLIRIRAEADSSAATEGESLWPSTVLVAAVSGVAGLLVMTLLVFSMNSLGVRPFLKKRGTEHAIRARDP